MEQDHGAQHEANLAYWRGRVDGHLESLRTRLDLYETRMESRHKDNVERLDHMHACFERRSKVLYILSGGIAVLVIFFQVIAPLLLKGVFKL